jgi:hemerythrin superfamily protein
MKPISSWNGKLTVPNALLLGHDEARADIARATMAGGRIAKAGKRLAQLCLPHFEHEEEFVFPLIALLPDLERGNIRREMMDSIPMVFAFGAMHDQMSEHHYAIASAIADLLQAAQKEKSTEFAEFAHCLKAHERIEDEVIYPRAILVGRYLREMRVS